MLSFFGKRKEKDENIKKIQFMEEKFQLQETIQKEQWTLHQENMQKLLSRQRKSESVTESILETIEEHTDAFLLQEKIRNNENTLAGYILNYDQSLHQLERMIGKLDGVGSEWAKQIEVMGKQLRDNMTEMNLIIIRDSNIPINFKIHEVINVNNTSIYEENNMVCEVIVPGLIFRGEVHRKAKIIALKFQEETN